MMSEAETEFEKALEEAERELGISVGDDKPLDDATKEAPHTPELSDNAEYTVWYGTNRMPKKDGGIEFSGFSSERAADGKVYYGQCRIFVPKSHKIGSSGSAWWKRIVSEDDRLKILATDPCSEQDFWESIKKRLASTPIGHRDAVIFIHGFNVSFEEAAISAAQIGFDLSIKTAMAFFSWPSKGDLSLSAYSSDGSSIEASEQAIEDFIFDFLEKSGASNVHLIAHSMGNKGLIRALQAILKKYPQNNRVKFGNIILAAPDVDTVFFRNNCKCYIDSSIRTTLYVSQKDLAVRFSEWWNKYSRVGFAPPLFIAEGIDTINVTKVDLTRIGHGYIAEARGVLEDIYRLLTSSAAPAARGLQKRKNSEGIIYWEIRG